MKKITATVLVLCILFSFITPSMAASETKASNETEILNKIGLFKNLSSDFKKSAGKLQRSEAAVIITRLMCKETEMLQNKALYPVDMVKDIKSTDKNASYIGFVIKQKLMTLDAKGNFNPTKVINEKEFLTLLAKTLKYVEGINFKYNDIYKFAYNIGIVKVELYQKKSFNNYSYSRKEAIKAIYNSMKTKVNGPDTLLVSQLIDYKLLTREYALEVGLLSDSTKTQIVEVNAINNTQVEVLFNEPISTISDKDIMINGQDGKVNIYTSIASIAGNSIVLNMSGQTPDMKYVVELKNLKDKDGYITEKLASEFKGYKNFLITSDLFKISKIEVESKSIINVFFTQPINLSLELPMNYEIFTGSTSYIKGSFQTLIPRVNNKFDNCIRLYLKEKDLKAGEDYTLKITGNIQSAYGVMLNDGSGDSMNYKGKSSENTSFDVASVTPIDNKTIVVEFSGEVDRNSAFLTSNYKLWGNVVTKAVLSSGGEGKKVTLTVGNPLTENAAYELTINNVYDTYHEEIVNDVKYPFYGSTVKRDKIGIVSVQPIDKGTIAVYFDRPVESGSASLNTSYLITGGSGVGISKVSYDYKEPYMVKLFLASDSLTSAGNYTLTVFNALKDEAGNIFNSNATFSFNGTDEENIKPLFYEAKIVGKDIIKVMVSEDISTVGVNTIASNYWLEYKDGSNTKKKEASSVSFYSPSTLLIRFDSLSYSTPYTLKFNSLTDYTGINIRTSADGMTSIGVTAPN